MNATPDFRPVAEAAAQGRIADAQRLLASLAATQAGLGPADQRRLRDWQLRLAPWWWQPLAGGRLLLRRTVADDADFYRAAYQSPDFARRYNLNPVRQVRPQHRRDHHGNVQARIQCLVDAPMAPCPSTFTSRQRPRELIEFEVIGGALGAARAWQRQDRTVQHGRQACRNASAARVGLAHNCKINYGPRPNL